MVDKDALRNLNCIVLTAAHNEFKEKYNLDFFDGLFVDNKKILIDVKSIMNRKEFEARGYLYWGL
ncbi:hypothetical protein BET04_06770 [Caminicella sporogenes]|nr:hypothetical protein BET04_06770 [Caminicella sporogenes]